MVPVDFRCVGFGGTRFRVATRPSRMRRSASPRKTWASYDGAVAGQSLHLLTMYLPPALGQFWVGGLEAALDLSAVTLENRVVNVRDA